jgi:hypothetical protein
MSSRKTATATCPDDLPNETTKKGLSKVPDLLPESVTEPLEPEPQPSTEAVVVPDPVVDPPKH